MLHEFVNAREEIQARIKTIQRDLDRAQERRKAAEKDAAAAKADIDLLGRLWSEWLDVLHTSYGDELEKAADPHNVPAGYVGSEDPEDVGPSQ